MRGEANPVLAAFDRLTRRPTGRQQFIQSPKDVALVRKALARLTNNPVTPRSGSMAKKKQTPKQVRRAAVARKKKKAAKVAAAAVDGFLPYREYPLPAERELLAQRFDDIVNAEAKGQSVDQIGRMFLEASDPNAPQRFVERDVRGLEALMTWHGMGYQNHAGLTELGEKIRDKVQPFVDFWEFRRLFLVRNPA